jgi:HAD superfamily hydrolase (TIGR01509 family)
MLDPKSLIELLEQKKLFIFDFDGTLVDTSPLHARAFSKVLAPYGITVDYQSIAGMKTSDAMKKCLLSAGIILSSGEINALVNAKQQHVRTLIQEELLPLQGVETFLRWAKLRYRLAMYSSGSRGTVNIALDKLGYSGWFDPMLCSDDVAHAKPDPEGYLMILRITGINAREAIVFEDSISGLRAAQATQASVLCIGRNLEDRNVQFTSALTWPKINGILNIQKEG